MNILVTGGAGYIGSVAVKELIKAGHEVIVIDNLIKGNIKLIDPRAIFYQGDLIDLKFLEKVFSQHRFEAVLHFAGYKAAGESMELPQKYSDNFIGTINLLNALVKYKVPKIIFSSSAAVYGEPKYTPIDENHPLEPINYYGFTKLESERIIDWYSKLKGIVGIKLRYFNVAGDGGLNYTDPDAKNIFPIIQEVISGKRDKLMIFGDDYPTSDGTCIRDYIDVNDLVRAHILALKLERSETINLGTATGTSVKEIISLTEETLRIKLAHLYGPRRDGDPAILTASNEKAKKLLGWVPEKSIKDMIKSSLRTD
ncbi:MAG: UDP-glucose 4-epimerase GalE [Nanoarchaeota archaeon]